MKPRADRKGGVVPAGPKRRRLGAKMNVKPVDPTTEVTGTDRPLPGGVFMVRERPGNRNRTLLLLPTELPTK